MSRRRLHTLDDLLDVAEQIVTTGDPAGLTLRALAAAAGASNGTIYHAFNSKDELLARLWLRSWLRLANLMSESLEAAEARPTGRDAVVSVALAPVEFVRRFPESARLFFAQRRDQLFSGDVPIDVEGDLLEAQKRFIDLMITLAKGVWQRGDRIAVEAISVCVVDLPSGILRRRLLEGRGADDATSARIEAAVRGILAVPLEPLVPRQTSSRSNP